MTSTAQTIIDGAATLRTDPDDATPATILASYAEYARHVETELRRQVAIARSMGMSWTEIGNVFGVTKQAAQQRYGS